MGLYERLQAIETAARRERLFPPAEIQKTKAVRFPSEGSNRRAKAQEPGQGNGKLSVKLLGPDGLVTGSAFDVYAFLDKATLDMANYHPPIATGDILLVTKDLDGNWYISRPSLNEKTDCA